MSVEEVRPSAAHDRRAIAHLVECGADLTLERPFRHFLTAPNRRSAAIIARQISEAGYDTSSVPSAAMDAWIVVAERLAIVDDTAVRLARSFMELIASRHAGAAYDRWDAELTDDDGDVELGALPWLDAAGRRADGTGCRPPSRSPTSPPSARPTPSASTR